MSKIGKLPVVLPEGVVAEVSGHEIKVAGPKGNLNYKFAGSASVEVKDGKIEVSSKKETKLAKAIFGTTRALIANMVLGVAQGWKKELELVGTGYRGEVQGNTLILTIGFSHPVKFEALEGVTFKVEKSIITVEGIDKELVGRTAANIRAARPPEPYKGKGIKYVGEVIRRKAGKAAKTVGASV